MTQLDPCYQTDSITLYHGDCLEVMPTLEAGSVDTIFTDPPYPYIKREYGYWTEETWIPMMQEIVRQSRRILKPHGSMVMILQPNSEKVGKMRPWLWKFMAWCCEEWNMVQDVYWWNYTALPTVHTHRDKGLMRPSVKPCIWLGTEDCYRNQDAVLLPESKRNADRRKSGTNNELHYSPSGYSVRDERLVSATLERGGVTPYNILPIPNTNSTDSASSHGHGAGTPLALTDWWLRYISKSGDTILDPFAGTSTTGVAALNLGRKYIGIEQIAKYIEISKERLEKNIPVERELRGEWRQYDRPTALDDLPLFSEAHE